MSKLKLTMRYVVCAATMAFTMASYSQDPASYVKQLARVAPDIHVISMYYTPYTDATFDSNEDMKTAALYKITINCLLSCDMYIKNIIKQFSQSTKMTRCPSMMGSRYLLIELRGKYLDFNINYLKWGNIIVYNDECFYNKQSIDAVVPSPRIFDGMLREGNSQSK